MGYRIDREFDLFIPEHVLPSVLDVLSVDPHADHAVRLAEIVDAFGAAYNEGGEVVFEAHADEHTGAVVGYSLIGFGWGKTRAASDDDTTMKLAHLGVTGTIDCNGEDESLWRERLHGGEVSIHKGVVVYPSDHFPE